MKELNGEMYSPCWLEEGVIRGYSRDGKWAAEIRYVNVEDIDRSLSSYRTFDWAFETSEGFLFEGWLDLLWEESISHGRVIHLGTRSWHIHLNIDSVGIDSTNEMIDRANEFENASKL